MKTVNVYFYSRYGQSEKIAHRICRGLEMAGWTPVLYSIARLPPDYRMTRAQQYVICAPLHKARYGNAVESLLSHNRDILSSKQSAFVSVSMSAHGNEQQKEDARQATLKLFKRVRWEPDYFLNAAGALNYRTYNPFIRFAMRRICEKTGGPTDTTRDYEFTNWDEVDRFSRDLIERSLPSHFSHEIQFPEETRLNQLMPLFDIAIEHQIFIPCERRLAFAALATLRPNDMFVASVLAKIRTLGGRNERELGFKESSEKFGIVPLFEEIDRETIGGLLGRFWQLNFGIKRFSTPSAFLNFQEANYTKVVSNFYFKDVSGGCVVHSQTRMQSTDKAGRRHFKRYWMLLSPGIKLYMKSILTGIRRSSMRQVAPSATIPKPAIIKSKAQLNL